MGKLPLTEHQRAGLLAALHQAHDARQYRRLLAIVLVDRGKPIAQVARDLDISRVSVHLWLRRYLQSRDPAGVADRLGRGRRGLWNKTLEALLEQVVQKLPSQLGYRATQWTVPLLREYLQTTSGQMLSVSTLRRHLRALDYVYKRPRHKLQRDPAYQKKTRDCARVSHAGRCNLALGAGRNRCAALSAAAQELGEAW